MNDNMTAESLRVKYNSIIAELINGECVLHEKAIRKLEFGT